MRAIVLVGGQGTRLRPLTYDIPKPMLPIVDRPIIERIADWLARFDVTDVVLSLGYRPDAFLEAFPSGELSSISLHYAVEPEPLDTAGAIAFAARDAGIEGERFVVVNGDILTDLDLAALIAFHDACRGSATIALTPVDDPSAFGVVPTDAHGRVEAFIEKPAAGSAPTNLINAGIYVLEPEVLGRIAPDRKVSIEREVFPSLVADRRLFALGDTSYWIDTGTPERYLDAQFDILSGRRPGLSIGTCREPSPGVFSAHGAVLGGLAHPPVYLGAGARVDPGAVVASSVVGPGVLVEAGASVRGSVLLDGAVVHGGSRVEDSIVGPRAEIGHDALVAARTIVGACAVVAGRSALNGARVPQ